MIRITSTLWDDYIYRFNDSLRNQVLLNHTAKWGMVRVTLVPLADIRLFVVDFTGEKACPVTLEINTTCLMMNFTLSGQSQPDAEGFSFHEGKHYSLFSSGHLKFTVTLQSNLVFFIVCFLEDSLKKSLPVALGHEQLKLFQTIRSTTPQMSQVIQSIMNNIDKKGNHHIYFEAKALEVLFLELEQVEQLSGQSTNSFLKEHDLERIHQAKTIVAENLLNPCSLIELAHKVGLNDFKLKKGFREVLGTTVFGYLYDLRMEKAKELLMDGRSVREVAYEVGYKNAHHFTAAFKKKYGCLLSKANRFLGMLVFIYSLIDALEEISD